MRGQKILEVNNGNACHFFGLLYWTLRETGYQINATIDNTELMSLFI